MFRWACRCRRSNRGGCCARVHRAATRNGPSRQRHTLRGSADVASRAIYAREGQTAKQETQWLKKQQQEQELGSFCLVEPGSEVYVPRHDRTVKSREWNKPPKMKTTLLPFQPCMDTWSESESQSSNAIWVKVHMQSHGITNLLARLKALKALPHIIIKDISD